MSSFSIIKEGFRSIKDALWLSLFIVILLTIALSFIFYAVESTAQPEVYTCYSDALVWAYTRYIEGGDGVFEGCPMTVLGKVIASLFGFIGIAIVAIPAGLLGSGFMEAIEISRRQKELEGFHKKMVRAFAVGPSRQLKQYLEKLPKDEKAWYYGCNFGHINNNVNIAKFQLKGMDLKDILDTCNEYSDFRVKNEASAMSIEEGKDDRYMLEHYPVNRRYGFFKERGSKITIVSTSSHSELCTGNFSYYLAKFAGFNYISKDFNAADGESYYNNHWKEPFYEGVTMQERIDKGEKINKELRKAYDNKKTLRNEFLSDLKSLCKDEDSWVICILSHVKNQENKVDVQMAHSTADGANSVINDKDKCAELLSALRTNLGEELQLSVEETTRYPLIKRGTYRNLLYKLQDDGCKCNGLTLRVSSHLMEFDVRMRVAQFIMAKTIHDVLEPEHRLLQSEVEDMNRTSRFYGFADQKIDKIKPLLFESE